MALGFGTRVMIVGCGVEVAFEVAVGSGVLVGVLEGPGAAEGLGAAGVAVIDGVGVGDGDGCVPPLTVNVISPDHAKLKLSPKQVGPVGLSRP